MRIPLSESNRSPTTCTTFAPLSFQQYLDEYPKVFVVGADNVGSRQMQKIRLSLRGHAGKGHLTRTCRPSTAVLCNSSSDDGQEHHDEKDHSWTSVEKREFGEIAPTCLRKHRFRLHQRRLELDPRQASGEQGNARMGAP